MFFLIDSFLSTRRLCENVKNAMPEISGNAILHIQLYIGILGIILYLRANPYRLKMKNNNNSHIFFFFFLLYRLGLF